MTSVMDLQPMSHVEISQVLESNKDIKRELNMVRVIGAILLFGIVGLGFYYHLKNSQDEKAL